MQFYQVVCRLCKVMYVSHKPFPPLEESKCFCDHALEEYVKEDHRDYEPLLLNYPENMSPKRKEKARRHAKT